MELSVELHVSRTFCIEGEGWSHERREKRKQFDQEKKAETDMASEQEPLLPSTYPREQPEQVDLSQTGLLPTWRDRLSEALESVVVHKFIITLVCPFLATACRFSLH
jgi:hypothetical protein